MGSFSLIHWLILGVVILLLFGGNRFSSMMGDVAKGLKSFKQGMADDDRPQDPRALPPGQQTPTPFQNPQAPYGQNPQGSYGQPPQQPVFGQQAGQQSYQSQQQAPEPIELTPEPTSKPSPNMSPARGVPPGDDQVR